MSLVTRHAVLILVWAALDVVFIAACWCYGVMADRAIEGRRWIAARYRHSARRRRRA